MTIFITASIFKAHSQNRPSKPITSDAVTAAFISHIDLGSLVIIGYLLTMGVFLGIIPVVSLAQVAVLVHPIPTPKYEPTLVPLTRWTADLTRTCHLRPDLRRGMALMLKASIFIP